jgi:hypothetical protein
VGAGQPGTVRLKIPFNLTDFKPHRSLRRSTGLLVERAGQHLRDPGWRRTPGCHSFVFLRRGNGQTFLAVLRHDCGSTPGSTETPLLLDIPRAFLLVSRVPSAVASEALKSSGADRHMDDDGRQPCTVSPKQDSLSIVKRTAKPTCQFMSAYQKSQVTRSGDSPGTIRLSKNRARPTSQSRLHRQQNEASGNYEGFFFADALLALTHRRAVRPQRSSDRLRMDAQLDGDVLLVDTERLQCSKTPMPCQQHSIGRLSRESTL